MASPEVARSAATLYLTLTLDRSRFPNISSADVGVAALPIPGVLRYGDGDSTSDQSDLLTVLDVGDEWILARATLVHTYPHAHRHGNPWEATYEYCCRGKSLQNNQETTLSLRTEVDLTFSSSPILPRSTIITFQRSPRLQQYFLAAHHPGAHPLLFALGVASDYGSSQSGTPQGLRVAYSTGHVTWDTSHVMPGRYSVQVVVEDAFTGIQVRDIQS